MKVNTRLANVLLAALVALTALPSTAQEPYGLNDNDVVYSDKGWVHYQLTRTELDNAVSDVICLPSQSLGSLSCSTAVHRFCGSRGHASGFALENDSTSALADIFCLSPAAVDIQRGKTADDLMPSHIPDHPNCSFIDGSINCSIAIDRYCRRELPGSPGGFGPVEYTATKAAFVCIKQGYLETQTGVQRSAIESGTGCTLNLAQNLSHECGQALDSYCRLQNEELRGGMAPGELSTTKARINCVHESFWQANTALPDSPALPVDVLSQNAVTDGGGNTILDPNLNHNVVNHNRSTSFDGRVHVEERIIGNEPWLAFGIQNPEIFDTPVSQEPVPNQDRSFRIDIGSSTFGQAVRLSDLFPNANGALTLSGKSAAICDPHNPTAPGVVSGAEQSVPERINNPFACDAGGNVNGTSADDHDCYELTVLSTARGPGTDPPEQLWGKNVRVVVQAPKKSTPNHLATATTRANVVNVIPSAEPAQMATGTPVNIIEPTVTGDGKLLFIQGDSKIQYSVIPEAAAPCDVTKWDEFKELEYMHGDPEMQRYGLAKFPLRDYQDNILSPATTLGRGIRGAYPWVSRDGDVLAFMAAQSSLFFADSTNVVTPKFPIVGHPTGDTSHPVPSAGEDFENEDDVLARVGLTLVGSWTQGKFVQPDNRNNAADFLMPGDAAQHRMIRLYEDQPQGVEVGSTLRTKIGSPENQFFHYPNLRPDAPREVVWNFATHFQMDEIEFDDWLDPRALVVSSMTTPVRSLRESGFVLATYLDGFNYLHTMDTSLAYRYGGGFASPAHIANEATSVSSEVADAASAAAELSFDYSTAVQWNVPSHGRLLGGARAEPIAAGGIKGRGIWLDGEDDRLEYIVPEQPTGSQTDFTSTDWFIQIALDPRNPNAAQRLLLLPDGTWLNLLDSQSIAYGRDVTRVDTLTLPAALQTKVWSTLAVVSSTLQAGTQTLDFYADGYLFATRAHSDGKTYFRIEPGRIQLGNVAGGFKGWVDDFKIIARRPNPEVICNHARGTLVGVPDATSPLYAQADAYPTSSHVALSNLLPLERRYSRYACERPIDAVANMDIYDVADHANYQCLGQIRRLDQVADADLCLRDVFLFPEGASLFHDAPRPDSVTNAFCLSCHVDSNPLPTLQATPALSIDAGIDAIDDPRRQPMQWSPKIFGIIPDGLFGCGTTEPPPAGEDPCRSDAAGRSLDLYLMPSHP